MLAQQVIPEVYIMQLAIIASGLQQLLCANINCFVVHNNIIVYTYTLMSYSCNIDLL